MPLRLRLILSYFLVVTVFVLTLVLVWAAYSALPTYRLARQTLGSWIQQVALQAQRAYQTGGESAVESRLAAAIPPPDVDLTIFWAGRSHSLWGRPLPPQAESLQLAQQGRIRVSRSSLPHLNHKALVWLPLKDPQQKVVGVLCLALPARLPPEVRSLVGEGLVISLASGASLALGLAWLLSRRISRPVEELQRAAQGLGEGDLSRRVDQRGGGELSELAARFNAMAHNLQLTLESQRQFLQDASHNLRTPLTAIQGWTEALQDGLMAGEEAKYLEKIHRQTQHMATTVARLLELSRWQTGQVQLNLQTLSIGQPLLEAVDALAELAEARGVSLRVEGDTNVPLRADRERLRDVFQVLLENCLQHAGPQVEVLVSLSATLETLTVVVQDNGQGASAPLGAGGLGLSIARRLLEAHGGRFEWSSQPGQGTQASFTLPLQSSQLV